MYYKENNYPKKVQKRINRHKRTRYHNDAALFNEDTYDAPRKRTKSLMNRDLILQENKEQSSDWLLQ